MNFEPKNYSDIELEILASVGALIIAKLKGHDDVARKIFDELAPDFVNQKYPYLKVLTHTVLQHTHQETPEELDARLRAGIQPETLRLLEIFEEKGKCSSKFAKE